MTLAQGGKGLGHIVFPSETELRGWQPPPVPVCHWDELVSPPCCAGGNFAAKGSAHIHEAFKYL